MINLDHKHMTNTDLDVFVDGEKVETEVKIIPPFGTYFHYLCYTFKTLEMNKIKMIFKRAHQQSVIYFIPVWI